MTAGNVRFLMTCCLVFEWCEDRMIDIFYEVGLAARPKSALHQIADREVRNRLLEYLVQRRVCRWTN